MFAPLNPQLYAALERRFTSVEIANHGERAMFARGSYYSGGGSRVVYSGEYYKISCPYCNDARKRLWINHMFGVVDESKDDHLYMAHCFNEGCVNSREIQKELYEMIYPFQYTLRMRKKQLLPDMPVSKPAVVPANAPTKPIAIPLDSNSAYMARDYLADRGFDPTEIGARWSITYCMRDDRVRPNLWGRLVIPIYGLQEGPQSPQRGIGREVYLGWQARTIIADSPSNPRYLSMTGLKKSTLLYGLPQVHTTIGPVVIVEGVTDVWRMKTDCVATLGKSLSQEQIGLILRHFRGMRIVLLFDADATDDANRAAQLIRAARTEWADSAPVSVAMLPPGKGDVAECTRDEAWACVWRITNR